MSSTTKPERFPYVARDASFGDASLAPLLPLVLAGNQHVSVSGLLDSGAAINVLPWSVGLDLGFNWDQQTNSVDLSGNLAPVEARIVVVSAAVGTWKLVRLAFAWAKTDHVSVILGQINFFLEFDVCFFRSRAVFDIRPK